MKILLADNHKLFSDGLRSLLEKEPLMDIVGEANNGRMAVRMARELAPELIIMDVGMPDLNGMEATRQIRSEMPNIKILAVSMHADRQYVSGMLSAGASGYVLKDSAFDELNNAIQVVRKGGRYLSPSIVDVVVDDYVQHLAPQAGSALEKLSTREREVLQMIAEGNPTVDIAKRLCVSRKTIETHRKNLMIKLELHSVAELTKFAIQEGLTSLEILSRKSNS